MEYLVTDIQRFCVHDGDGIRTTVFLQGCPLTCKWCHNPETQSTDPQFFYDANKCVGCGACAESCVGKAHTVCDEGHLLDRTNCVACKKCYDACVFGAITPVAKTMTDDEIVKVVMKDAAYYENGGGVTLSGGEPLFDFDKAVHLFKHFKEKGLNTAVETSGMFIGDVKKLEGLIDIALYDVKDTDEKRLLENTGADLELVLKNLKALDEIGVKTVLRLIMLKGVNMTEQHAKAVFEIYKSLENCQYAELLPYHTYGESKNERLGNEPDPRDEWVPSKDELLEFAKNMGDMPIKVSGTML
ncbi:MAG: glycyl-radical enzyme activating protein [Clostridia bacterium]|nr:glycyl-radical enzyme activating protein [Clostridia bacterium]